MQRVRIHLENCYGIKHLETVLDYSDTQVQALYAPNPDFSLGLWLWVCASAERPF